MDPEFIPGALHLRRKKMLCWGSLLMRGVCEILLQHIYTEYSKYFLGLRLFIVGVMSVVGLFATYNGRDMEKEVSRMW